MRATCAERVRKLARLGDFERLRQFGVPKAELPEVAEQVVQRPGEGEPARQLPEVEELLRSIW